MDFIEMDFIDDAERQDIPEYDEIEMILQATRTDMTRLSVLMDKIHENTYKKNVYYDEVLEVIAILLWIFRKNKEKDNE